MSDHWHKIVVAIVTAVAGAVSGSIASNVTLEERVSRVDARLLNLETDVRKIASQLEKR